MLHVKMRDSTVHVIRAQTWQAELHIIRNVGPGKCRKGSKTRPPKTACALIPKTLNGRLSQKLEERPLQQSCPFSNKDVYLIGLSPRGPVELIMILCTENLVGDVDRTQTFLFEASAVSLCSCAKSCRTCCFQGLCGRAFASPPK